MDKSEKIARIIEPTKWLNYDRALAPYQRGTGSIGDENWLYEDTYRFGGCRTTQDVIDYFRTGEADPSRHTYSLLLGLRDSLAKADAILSLGVS